jgi:predicted AAA+ superfamily ATPase
MAISNRDRVGKGFEILSEGLRDFVTEKMNLAFSQEGMDWIQAIESRDASKNGIHKTYEIEDPAFQLRMITDEWRVFGKFLSRAQQSLASELRDVRNKWAHNEKFSSDDTYRVLDTIERLLLAVGSNIESDLVRQLRLDHQRIAFESETRRAAQQPDGALVVAGTGLKSWREVLRPHDDVATGNYSASEFAADLYMVSQNEGSQEYVEPVEFFRRTYLTEGLRELLDRGIRRICGDENASPIINLQTNFGGGKTHSMLALWHLFSSVPTSSLTQEVQELVSDRKLPAKVNRVALVGIHLSPGAPQIKEDGTRVNTIWGELAWQLGGRSAFEYVAEADATRTNPGEGLRQLISAYSPCLILIDEWVAYARQLWEREDLPGGTFDTQFTFAQSLTEIVKTIPGAMLVISIPASHDPEKDGQSGGSALEVGGPNGQEALQRLQNVVRRVADQWRPASAQESFEIVRRRLFVEPNAAALSDISAVARQFVTFYMQHVGEFPRECSDISYEARIRAAYPIHPELFDRLYEDWSTLERFQRTRGVLRLMSSVVHALWESQDAGPLIMPGSLPLDVPTVLSEITQYLPDSWKPIVDADIDGIGSTPVQIDSERPLFGQRALTRRLARTIFVGAAPTLKSSHIGAEKPRIWLGVAIPGDTVGNFGSALDLLAQRATYLYADGHRYWFDTQASVTRTAADFADRLREKPEEVWAEIVQRMRSSESRNRGAFSGVHIAPDTSADIPDEDSARLVILHPSLSHSKNAQDSSALKFAAESLEKRGSAQRINKNMLAYLAADSKRLEELMEAVRDFLAWQNITGRIEEMNLSQQQAKQAITRRDQAEEGVKLRISQSFIWAIVPEQPEPSKPIIWTVEKSEGQETSLTLRTSEKLIRAGLFTDVASPRMIRMDLDSKLIKVWESGHVNVGQLWSLYSSYPYLARMKNRQVLADAVAGALNLILFDEEGFALAEGFDSKNGKYLGLTIPGAAGVFGAISDQTLIVKPDVASNQVKETASTEAKSNQETTIVGETESPETQPIPETQNRPAEKKRYFGVFQVDAERYGRDLNRLSQEVLQHISSLDNVDLEISIEIQAKSGQGFPQEKMRVILENAKALKFKQSSFEDE